MRSMCVTKWTYCIDFTRFLLWFFIWVLMINKTAKRRQKKRSTHRMEKLFNLVAIYIVICFRMYGNPIMATATANGAHHDPFHSIRHMQQQHLRLMWFRIMKKPLHTSRFATRRCALNSWIKPLQVKIWQSMRPTDRPVGCWAGFAEAQNVILFLALFAFNSMKIAQSKLNPKKQHIHSLSHTHTLTTDSSTLAHTHFTNNLIFGTAIRTLSIPNAFVHTHILFAAFIVRSNRYTSVLFELTQVGESTNSALVYSAHNGPPTKWLQLYKEWESQRSALYTTHDSNGAHTINTGPGIAKWLVLVCVCWHVYIYICEWMNERTDGWINLSVCEPVSLYTCMRACEWQAKSKNLYVCFDNRKRDKLKNKPWLCVLSLSLCVYLFTACHCVWSVTDCCVYMWSIVECVNIILTYTRTGTLTHNHSLVHAITLCFARFVSFAFCVQSFPIVARLKRLCFVYLWQFEIVRGKSKRFRYSSIQHRLSNTEKGIFSSKHLTMATEYHRL